MVFAIPSRWRARPVGRLRRLMTGPTAEVEKLASTGTNVGIVEVATGGDGECLAVEHDLVE